MPLVPVAALETGPATRALRPCVRASPAPRRRRAARASRSASPTAAGPRCCPGSKEGERVVLPAPNGRRRARAGRGPAPRLHAALLTRAARHERRRSADRSSTGVTRQDPVAARAWSRCCTASRSTSTPASSSPSWAPSGSGKIDADEHRRPARPADQRAPTASTARTSPSSTPTSCAALRRDVFGFVFQQYNLLADRDRGRECRGAGDLCRAAARASARRARATS